ncbi:MAG TPA: hypothetical protein VHX18_09545 [Rhizomicrobium sp.]|jgi:hypothetical protein|nr:hypothetical protein [Rhizomicrobium sp.]
MTIRFLKRASAGVGAIAAVLSVTPALADSSMDAGPVTVTLGGFLASEGVYRSRNETADIGSSFSAIPFTSTAQGHTSETRFTARQSRLTVMAQGDVNSDTHLTFWNEMDFLGAAQTANSNESNSYNLRIRNMYTTIDWDSLGLSVLAGQNWSLATANTHGITPRNELVPATIEAQYVVGFNWARQPQLRVTKNWNKEFWVALSIENPQTTFAGNAAAAPGITVVDNRTGGSLFNSANSYSLNHIPDVIGKFAWEPRIGDAQPLHMEVYGIYRDFYDRTQIAAGNAIGFPVGNQNADRAAGGVGGSITYTAIPKTLDLQATALTGSGIGRYGSGNLPDATFRPDGTLAPIQETTWMFGGTWHTTPLLDIYAYGGQEAEQRKTFQVGAATLGLGSPTLNLSGCLVENGSCPANLETENQITAGFWWRAYQGKFGSFRLGAQYSYTHLTAFGGAAGVKPTTDDSMVFTSIRYYPF